MVYGRLNTDESIFKKWPHSSFERVRVMCLSNFKNYSQYNYYMKVYCYILDVLIEYRLNFIPQIR